ncbi:MAG: hypothetical protein ABR576_03775 [Thermoanaerobaculia bacterium]
MRAARGLLAIALAAAAVAPEIRRYAAERRLAVASEAFRILLRSPQSADDPIAALDRVATLAETASDPLPGDPRPWILSGSAHLTAGRPERALESYASAFDRAGERAEVDLNIGRAETLLGRDGRVRVAFLRAGWISPALLAALPPQTAQPVLAEIARLEEELRAGRLEAPPPPPR